jgi:protein-L-isoaspartate(D-aspartate) O-methyltransferase
VTSLDQRRRFVAEELEAVARLGSTALVEAFAAVPREQFLPPGPWTVLVGRTSCFSTTGSIASASSRRDSQPS